MEVATTSPQDEKNPRKSGGFLLEASYANGFRQFRNQPCGGLFSKLAMPRKQWALCSRPGGRSSEPLHFFLRLKESLVRAYLTTEAH